MSWNPQVLVTTGPQTNVVQVATVGPQGPPGPNASPPTTVAALGTPVLGYRSLVTDATSNTFASIVSGGGTTAVPVYADGVNWRIG